MPRSLIINMKTFVKNTFIALSALIGLTLAQAQPAGSPPISLDVFIAAPSVTVYGAFNPDSLSSGPAVALAMGDGRGFNEAGTSRFTHTVYYTPGENPDEEHGGDEHNLPRG